jgi:hypothetical protein
MHKARTLYLTMLHSYGVDLCFCYIVCSSNKGQCVLRGRTPCSVNASLARIHGRRLSTVIMYYVHTPLLHVSIAS